MNLTLFGATGALGSECLQQALAAGHTLTVLVRNAGKLPAKLRDKVQVIEGNALNAADVQLAITDNTDAVLFAIGVDKHSPQNLCADATRLIFERMEAANTPRFIWCGGGSSFAAEDQITFGARFVRKFAGLFMSLRHDDKVQQYQFLDQNRQIPWLGVRPLQMKKGPLRKNYRLGFDTFSGMSSISFADCAHGMLSMLDDDHWLGKAPIIQY